MIMSVFQKNIETLTFYRKSETLFASCQKILNNFRVLKKLKQFSQLVKKLETFFAASSKSEETIHLVYKFEEISANSLATVNFFLSK